MARAPHRNKRSWWALLLGALALGTGVAWMLSVEWGIAPLDAFIAGTSDLTGLTVGTVAIVILMPLAMGWLTPRFRKWVHAVHVEEEGAATAGAEQK